MAKPQTRPELRPKRETPAEAPPPAALVWAVRIALALAVLITIPLIVEQYEAPKIWVVRILGLGTLVALPFALRLTALRTPVDFAVLAMLGAEIIATLSSESRRVSVLGEPLQREGLLTSLALGGLYFAARAAHPAGRSLRATLRWFWIPAAVCAAYALVQVAGLDPVKYATFAVSGAGTMRPFGTLGHSNLLGVAMAAAVCLMVGEAIRSAERRPLHVALAALFVMVTVATLSRAAWLGTVAGVLVTVILGAPQRARAPWSRRDLAIAGGAVLVMVIAFYGAGWTKLFTQRAAELVSTGGSAGSRLEIWKSAIAAFQASPAVGHGPDTFDMIFTRFQTPQYWLKEWGLRPFHAHSIYLHELATRGVVGAVASLSLILAGVVAIRRLSSAKRRASAEAEPEASQILPAVAGMLVAIAVAGAFGAIGITGALLGVVVAGWLASAVANVPVNRRGGTVPALALGVAAAIVTVFAIRDLTASHYIARARLLNHADPHRAEDYAEKAVKTWPYDDQSWRVLSEATLAVGMSEESFEHVERADRAARRAIDMVPARPLNHQRLAEVLSVLAVTGDQDAALLMRDMYLQMFRYSPQDVTLRAQAARAELGIQSYHRAMQIATEATRMDPTYAPAWLVIARGLERLHQRDSALVVLDRAMRSNWHDELNRRDYAIALYQQIQSEIANPATVDTLSVP